MARAGIVYLSQLSDACRVELHELCRDHGCECYCHTDELEPLELTPEQDDASILHAEARFEAMRDD